MADNTSRMVSLLGALRREMNGAVADAMSYYGTRYGLNYGVSLPTIRSIAAKEERNNSLALYLYKQDVRELRLAALHIAEPQSFADDEDEWMEGISTSEIAEEMAFALLRHTDNLPALYSRWSRSEKELQAYAVVMAVARSTMADNEDMIELLPEIVAQHPTSRLIAQGAVALLSATLNTQSSDKIKALLEKLPPNSTTEYINDEMAWRME